MMLVNRVGKKHVDTALVNPVSCDKCGRYAPDTASLQVTFSQSPDLAGVGRTERRAIVCRETTTTQCIRIILSGSIAARFWLLPG